MCGALMGDGMTLLAVPFVARVSGKRVLSGDVITIRIAQNCSKQ